MKLKHLLSLALLILFTGKLDFSYGLSAGSNNIFTGADSLFNTANLFQPGMVIQQQKPFAIWGNAVAGSTVAIKADWTNKTITVTAGEGNYWKGSIPVPKAIPGDFKAHTITVTSGTKTITLNNLLIGDVWVASGQSNMQFSVEGQEGKEKNHACPFASRGDFG